MSKYLKRDLVEMVRQAKRENKTCACYSKMKKDQLLNHAIEIGLIEGEVKEPDDLRKRNLKELERKVREMVFSSVIGNKKKSSFLRRVSRVLLMKDGDLSDEIMSKLVIDYNKLTSYA